MQESNLETNLPRLRRLALCLFCNTDEGDRTVALALGNVPHLLAEGHHDHAILEFLFSEILRISSNQFPVGDESVTPNLPIGTSHNASTGHSSIVEAVSELDLLERSVVALHILDGFDKEKTAEMLKVSVSTVTRSLQSARSHLRVPVSSPERTAQKSLSV